MAPEKAERALQWYCVDCGEEIDITIERDIEASVAGIILSGFHIHVNGEIIDLPPMELSFESKADFNDFAEVMRAVRQDVADYAD